MKSVFVHADGEVTQIGSPSFDGFTFGGIVPSFDKALFPGARAIRLIGTRDLSLVSEVSDGPIAPVPIGYVLSVGITQYLTASGSFNRSSLGSPHAIQVELLGGGGAGGGAPAATAGNLSAGGGGSPGAYARKLILASDLPASQPYTVGAAGVPASGVVGGNGGDTQFGTVIAPGGLGGPILAAAAVGTPRSLIGAGPSGLATGGDLNIQGDRGFDIHQTGGGSMIGGLNGRESRLGGGGPLGLEANGSPGTGYGAGGGGTRQNGAGGPRTGGAGSPGVIVLTPFYAGGGAWEVWY